MCLIKLQKLAKLNEDLKDFNPDYLYTKHLAENNIRMAAKRGQEVNAKREFDLAVLEHDLEKSKQARLTYSRRLSDGSLECEFIGADWEYFTKIYTWDDMFWKKSIEYKEKIEKQKEFDTIAFQKFWDIQYITTPRKKAKEFWMALA